jgi:nitrate reductase (cytochrome), electron transfer subunit
MKARTPRGPVVSRRLLVIGLIALSMLVLVLLVGRTLTEGHDPVHPPVRYTLSTGEPIPAEAQVFRLRPGDVALDTTARRRPAAHRRTLAMYRAIRAYPGAPPRVPHGLTAEEYRTTGCNTCHERGGYVDRFAAYAPVTPHPEYVACLQCHVVDATIVGVDFPDPGRDGLCLQCHVRGDPRPSFAMTNWRPLGWPEVGQRALEGSPPLIPHDFQLRGNCLACHLGPSAVDEIRTSHAERSDCRQCHVPAAPDAGVYSRPASEGSRTGGGGS